MIELFDTSYCVFTSFLLGFEIIEFILGTQLYGSFAVEGLKNCFSSILPKCLFINDRNLAPISDLTLSLKGGLNQMAFLFLDLFFLFVAEVTL